MRPRFRLPVQAPVLWGMALAGAGTTVLALAVSAGLPLGDIAHVRPVARVLLLASVLSLGIGVALAPARFRRVEMLAAGLAALGAEALLVGFSDPLAVAVVLLLVGFGTAARPGLRPFAARVRGPALAAVLLGIGWTFATVPGPGWLGRVGALALALALIAAAGLLPFMPDLDPNEPASSSYLVWTGFFGPALALSLPAGLIRALNVDEGTVFGATLIALGLVNLAMGTIGAWLTASDANAWRYSFLADWGLALVGLGVLLPSGRAAAYLALLAIVLVRLPLSVWARPALRAPGTAAPGRVNAIVVVLLAGAAPFSGFPVRLLVLQAATQLAWPLAVPLLAAMLLGIAHALRLARTLSVPRGRAAVGLWLTIGVSLGLGLAPGALRLAAGV